MNSSVAGRVAGKRAVVIGAGQTPGVSIGVGRATALIFAREGARILLVDRDTESVEATRSMIVDDRGSAVVCLADIRHEDECRRIAEVADEVLGGVDILFDSVGIQGPGSAIEVTEALWDAVLDVNVKAKWLVAKHILPLMQRQRSGSIIHISSAAAERYGALPGGVAVPYEVSKAALSRLTIALAASSAKYDVRANAILPGLIDTPMAIDAILHRRGISREELIAERQESVPMSFVANAFDVAYAALFLASDESRYISGQCLLIDGARSAT